MIFENVRRENEKAKKDQNILRISVDVKAKVKVGQFSRGGKSRKRTATKALDHDYAPDNILAPFGVLEVEEGTSTICFGECRETSDFIVDSLEKWYDIREPEIQEYKEFLINIDNGSTVSGVSQQFLKRMVLFAQKTQKTIHLLYYPPYHSKYNAIERFWGVIENYWNGMTLDSIPKVLSLARSTTWKKIHPIVTFFKQDYQKGVKPTKKEMKELKQYIRRSITLPKWDVYIFPEIINIKKE